VFRVTKVSIGFKICDLVRRINLTQLQLLSHRTKIRKRLRDKGVLIARGVSGERKGYKLPSSLAGVWLIIIINRKIESYFIKSY